MSTARSVVGLASDRNLTFLAAGIAYYAFVSLIPLMLLAIAVASFVGGQAMADRVVDLLSQYISSSGQEIITSTLTNGSGRAGATVVGFVALTWSALKLFRGLDQAFDELYDDEIDASLLQQVRDALVVVVGIAVAVTLVVAVGVALGALNLQIPFVNVIGALALVVVLVLAFLPIYYVLPPGDVSLGGILPGTVVAAVGWVLLQVGFRIYAANAGRYEAYGIIGAVLLFVTWLYFAAIVVLIGAAVNAVRRGPTSGVS